jgi:hypothetical protein
VKKETWVRCRSCLIYVRSRTHRDMCKRASKPFISRHSHTQAQSSRKSPNNQNIQWAIVVNLKIDLRFRFPGPGVRASGAIPILGSLWCPGHNSEEKKTTSMDAREKPKYGWSELGDNSQNSAKQFFLPSEKSSAATAETNYFIMMSGEFNLRWWLTALRFHGLWRPFIAKHR